MMRSVAAVRLTVVLEAGFCVALGVLAIIRGVAATDHGQLLTMGVVLFGLGVVLLGLSGLRPPSTWRWVATAVAALAATAVLSGVGFGLGGPMQVLALLGSLLGIVVSSTSLWSVGGADPSIG